MVGVSSWNKRASYLIGLHLDEVVTPIASAPCVSTVADGWTGIGAIDDSDLWLVNGAGARRAPLSMIDLVHIDSGSELPTYVFAFQGSSQQFGIQPLSRIASMSFRAQIEAVYRPIAFSVTG